MSTRGLDATGDWLFGKGQNDYVTGLQEVKQNVQTRLLVFLGECFFATDEGIDWFNLLGAKNKLALQLAISNVILNTYAVTKINSINITVNSLRAFTITYSIKTLIISASNPNGTVSTATGYILSEDGNIITAEDGSQLLY